MSSADPRAGWSADDAERYLLGRERFGMRFGLDRMRRLLNVLELPEVSFPTIHVVGTNGKSSTTRMIAALLERCGLRTGCFTSPHLLTYRERIQIGERDIAPEPFAAAIARTVHAAELVDRTASPAGDVVTQFELLTAAALCEFEAAGVDVAVLEAGLGGRYDATNVVDSRVAVLTNVGLEHTRYLGPTVTDIAREKLDVVRAGATLVLGADIDPTRSRSPGRPSRSAARRWSRLRLRLGLSFAPAAATRAATSRPRAAPRARFSGASSIRTRSPRRPGRSSCRGASRCSMAHR